jgi:hypothetical protein
MYFWHLLLLLFAFAFAFFVTTCQAEVTHLYMWTYFIRFDGVLYVHVTTFVKNYNIRCMEGAI